MGNYSDQPTNPYDVVIGTGVGAFRKSQTMTGKGFINAAFYGATGDGVTDDTAAIQKAITDLINMGGGTLFFPAGTYVLTSQITITQPIQILGENKGSHTNNTNGSGVGVTTFLWKGANGGTMFYYISAIANEYLFGGGMENCLIDGNSLSGTGIRGSSVGYMKFRSLEGRNFITQWILIDDANGVLAQFNEFDDLHFVYGANAATQNATGLALVGQVSGASVTQNHIKSMTGLVYNGALLYIGWSDNNVIEKLHGVASGTGYVLYLANGGALGQAENNVVVYMSGKVHADSNTKGNRIMHLISEGAGVYVDAGAQIHYSVEDYTRKAVYRTLEYKMSDSLFIPVGDMNIISGSAAAGTAALQWACFNLVDAASSKIGTNIPTPTQWDNGTITSLRILFTTDTANTSKQWTANVNVGHYAVLGGIATPQKQLTGVNIAVQDSIDVLNYYDVQLTLGFSLGDMIYIAIERDGANVNDTAAGNIQILGLVVNYVAAGPYSPGSGTYAVTNPYV